MAERVAQIATTAALRAEVAVKLVRAPHNPPAGDANGNGHDRG